MQSSQDLNEGPENFSKDIEKNGQASPVPNVQDFYLFETSWENENAYPTTQSKSWIPIENMSSQFTFSISTIQNIVFIKNEKGIVGWKKIRGDGNCYFRAVMSKFLENIHKPYISSEKLSSFLEIVKRPRKSNIFSVELPNSFEIARSRLAGFIQNSIEQKSVGKHIECFESLFEYFQNAEFDLDIIRSARSLAAYKYEEMKLLHKLDDFLLNDDKNTINEIISMGTEGGDLTLLMLPLALDCQVVHLNFFSNKVSQESFPHETENELDKIYLIRRSGHYDLIYPKQEQELDQYCFGNGCYYLLKDYKCMSSAISALSKQRT